METNAPAPWTLTGNGYVLLYRLPHNFASANSPYGLSKGGLSGVMLVDYHTTPVAPYRELLFIPGRVAYPGKTGYSISKIYVSTMASVIGGQANWGIPKEQADFEWQTAKDSTDEVSVSIEGSPFAKFKLKPFGLRFPITAAILPPVVQYRERKTFITRLQSQAWGQLARIQEIAIDEELFPPVHQFRPMAAIKVHDFKMVFPVPVVLPD